MIARRYARQAQLAEVGIEGQARIESLHVSTGGGDASAPAASLAAEVATRYLRGAGATVDGTAVVPNVELGLAPGPLAVGQGALAALVALRAAIGLGAPSDALHDSSAHTPPPGGDTVPR